MSHIEELNKLDSKEAKLNYLLSLDYPTKVRKKNGQVSFYITQLGLKVTNSDINAAFAELEEKRMHYFSEMIDIAAEDEIVMPESEYDPMKDTLGLKLYLIRYAFIFIFCVATAFTVGKVFTKSMNKGFDRLGHKLDRVINPSEDKRLERIDRFKKKAKAFKPYVEEIKKLID